MGVVLAGVQRGVAGQAAEDQKARALIDDGRKADPADCRQRSRRNQPTIDSRALWA
ncbi:hypothetical protein D3C73_1461020 [compost metagenome]